MVFVLGMGWSDNLRQFRPWRAHEGGAGSDLEMKQQGPWQLVEDIKGFRTYVARVPGSNTLALRGETVVNEHIGRLYTAFLDTKSALDWVRFLSEVEELPPLPTAAAADHRRSGAGGGVLFQRFDMPWPVKDREVVLQRRIQVDKRSKKMTATYHSTDHPLRPITSSAVRAIVHMTNWELTALGGGKTAVQFETRTDPKGALPGAVVGIMQKKFPRETIAGFVKNAKKAPVHKMMTKW